MNFDDFLWKNKWLVGGILVVVIIAGGSLIWWDKAHRTKTTQENQEIAELRQQNELLRTELSEKSKEVAGAASEAEEESDKVNINTASAEELDTLPGIGPVRATDIITYREENGDFQSIEEIKNIKGIGDKSFEDMKDLVTVGVIE